MYLLSILSIHSLLLQVEAYEVTDLANYPVYIIYAQGESVVGSIPLVDMD